MITLRKAWKKYSIDLTGADLSRVIGGFGWTIKYQSNPNGATFYLDSIRFENTANPGGDAYVITRDTFPPDAYSMMAAHTYDNALALLAFLSTNDPADAKRAKLLADSLVWAQQHDDIPDGRLRNVYYPDDLATGTTFGATGDTARHNYDKYGNGAGPGNMGWAMIALLNYYQKHGGVNYKSAAIQLGQWIYSNCHDTRGSGGYTGGYNGWPPSGSEELTYKSTEHNIDVYVAFMKLFEVTQNPLWKERALFAKRFVEAMWEPNGSYFYTGTGPDGKTINKDNYPVDVLPWGYLALGKADKYGSGLDTAILRHSLVEVVDSQTYEGFDFDDDKDGIWWEGTAQMVTAWWPLYYFSNDEAKSRAYANATKYQSWLRQAQGTAPRNNGKGLVATNRDKVTTGFDLPTGGDWYYYNRLHIGATAWFVFSEQKWNPYWGLPANKPIPYQGL